MFNNYRIHFVLVLILDVSNSLTARYAFSHDSFLFTIISMLCLASAGYFFIRLMEEQVGIVANVTWIALGALLVTLTSYFVYGETIRWWQGVGMLLILVGVSIVEFYGKENFVLNEVIIKDLPFSVRNRITTLLLS